AAAAAAARRLRDLVANLVLLVARQHIVAPAAVAAHREGRLAQALGADGDLLRPFRLRHPPGSRRVLDGLTDLGLGAAEEPLAVAEALGLGVQTPVDDLHRVSRSVIGASRTGAGNGSHGCRRTPKPSMGARGPHQPLSSTSSHACTTRPGA